MNLAFLDTLTLGDTDLSELQKFGKIQFYKNTPDHAIAGRLRDLDVVITNKVMIDRKAMDEAPNLKLICLTATGVNNVDLDYARAKNIIVKNVAGYSTQSVAQATFAMLFHLLHHNSYYDAYVKSGDYSRSPIFTHIGPAFWELKDKNFGVAGLGAIGTRVAEIAEAFGCRVSYFSTSGKNNNSHFHRINQLEELLSSSDIVSIHAPLNEHTRNLIGYDQLCLMKPTAYLINAGRGGIVNENDLARALDESLIAGAALDVLEREPIPENHPFLQLDHPDKIFITPHMAWTSIEARQTLIKKVCQNIEDFIRTGK